MYAATKKSAQEKEADASQLKQTLDMEKNLIDLDRLTRELTSPSVSTAQSDTIGEPAPSIGSLNRAHREPKSPSQPSQKDTNHPQNVTWGHLASPDSIVFRHRALGSRTTGVADEHTRTRGRYHTIEAGKRGKRQFDTKNTIDSITDALSPDCETLLTTCVTKHLHSTCRRTEDSC